MTTSSTPDYPLADSLALDTLEQHRALLEPTRLQIIELLSERAATASQLAGVLGRPKGTVGYHLGVLEDAGLVRLVRSERVRAVEARYYGRTARTFLYTRRPELGGAEQAVLAAAAAEMEEFREARPDSGLPEMSGVRHARVPADRAQEFADRLAALADEFASAERDGDVVYAMAVALYPTLQPHLGEPGEKA
ncbi:MAG TPA: winged helix-turn-helix domain-containing protein [Nocardioidaceae bacterium]|nr:winged helix-turn-helix domain-containing protein [Nocardioidaceae bacterium]